MRLLNVHTLELEYFHNPEDAGPYAILSHTWEDDEVLFEDVSAGSHERTNSELLSKVQKLEDYIDRVNWATNRVNWTAKPPDDSPESDGPQMDPLHRAKKKGGWPKVAGCCMEAERFGLLYVWIDTCCIFKGDSSELSEAINSMFEWYSKADVCFAFLGDVTELGSMRKSRWFTRGWTLQELLAPTEVLFYQGHWLPLGSRTSLASTIESITSVPGSVLRLQGSLQSCGVATKMSWAADRQTTRPEDKAYSLMGLFRVNMPTLYGEGEESAMFRLQSEIFKDTGDHSTLAWCHNACQVVEISWVKNLDKETFANAASHSLLATSTSMFSPKMEIGAVERFEYPRMQPAPYSLDLINQDHDTFKPWKYSAATHGIRVQLLIERLFKKSDIGFLAHLACSMEPLGNRDSDSRLVYSAGILLKSSHQGVFERVFPNILVEISPHYQNRQSLRFEDVHLTKNFKTASVNIGRTLWPNNGEYFLQLRDHDLVHSGVTLNAYSACHRWQASIGPQLRFKPERNITDTDFITNIVLFEDGYEAYYNQEHAYFAIRWTRSNDAALLFCINMDLPHTTTLSSLTALRTIAQTCHPSPRLQLFFSEDSKNGIRVALGIRLNGSDVHIYVSLSRRFGFNVSELHNESRIFPWDEDTFNRNESLTLGPNTTS